jgi:hypothetical protein
VKTNFAEIEREAVMADQLKVQAAEEAKLVAEKTAEEEQKQVHGICNGEHKACVTEDRILQHIIHTHLFSYDIRVLDVVDIFKHSFYIFM